MLCKDILVPCMRMGAFAAHARVSVLTKYKWRMSVPTDTCKVLQPQHCRLGSLPWWAHYEYEHEYECAYECAYAHTCRVLQATSLQAGLTALVGSLWGAPGLAVHLSAALMAQLYLSVIDYVLHYGLLRERAVSGSCDRLQVCVCVCLCVRACLCVCVCQ